MSFMTLLSRYRKWVGALCLILCWGTGTGTWAGEISKEYEVKAVYLFNFAQFVTWPEKVFTSDSEPFRIGILGTDPFDSFIDKTVKDEKVDGRSFVVERYDSIENVKDCQILFISSSEADEMDSILKILKGRSILTVGDFEHFAHEGGMIRLVMENNRVHFQVNMESAKKAHLVISSKMLRLAELVGGKE